MAKEYSRILAAIRDQPWALMPSVFEAMLEAVELRAAGGAFSSEELQARIGAGGQSELAAQRVNGVSVLPLHGVMAQRMNLFTAISGGTSTEVFGNLFEAEFADPAVTAVVVDGDTPGGAVAGTEELAQRIYRARQTNTKPIVMVANTLLGSAGYHVAAQGHQIVASPSSRLGSIGIIMAHTDVSKAEEMRGFKTTVLAYPPAKALLNPNIPLTEEAQADVMASNLMPFYDLFVKGVARGRGVTAQTVKDGYGGGRALPALLAKEAGLADRIEPLAAVIARLSTPQGRRAVLTAEAHSADDRTAQEPSPATAQAVDLRRLALQLELDTL